MSSQKWMDGRIDGPWSRPAAMCYQSLVDTMPLGLQHCDLSGRIGYSNAAHHRILGYPPGELVGKYIWDFDLTEESKESLKEYLAYLVEHQPPPEPYQSRNRRRDGEIIDVRIDWTYERDRAGKLIGFVATVSDVTELSKAQAKLIASESQYTDLYERAPDMMCSVDMRTQRVVRCNETLANALGYGKDEIVGRPYLQFYHPQCQDTARRAFELFDAAETEAEPELKLLCRDGRAVDVSLSASAVRDHHGAVVEIRTVWRDISRRKRAERALKQSEANLAAAQRVAHMGSWELDLRDPVDLAANELRWSDEVFRIFGYEPGGCEVSNQNFFAAVHPEDRPRITEAIANCLSSHCPYKLEHRIILPDGTERIVYEEGRIIEGTKTGAPLKMLGIVQDITERKRTEEALQSNHARLQRVLDSIIAYVGLLTPGGVIVETNQAPLESAGLSRGEVIGRPLVDTPWFAHSEQERDHLRSTIARVASGETVRSDFSVQMGAGNIITVDAVFSPLKNTAGDVVEIVISSIDVTQRRQAEDALQRLNADLEQRVMQRTAALHDKNEELEAFARTVSHDLRAPLRAMEGFAAVLKEDFAEKLGAEGAEFVDHIISAAQQMDTLIHDLLAYSKLGRKEIRCEIVSLSEAVGSAVAALKQEIADRSAILAIEDSLPPVRAHATLLVQSIVNLLSNAIKFVAPGITPRVRIRAETHGDDKVRLWVEDNGIGISGEHTERIFNVFERLHGVETYSGTGIGLAIVRRASERLGGACGVRSTVGKGSRFWMELPCGDEGNVPGER